MHSNESGPAPTASGPALVLQLGRLIVRARSPSPSAVSSAVVAAAPHRRLLAAKLLAAAGPSTSQVLTQPKPDGDERPGVEAQLSSHVQALWNNHVPICIEVLLAPDCVECYTAAARHYESRPERPLAAGKALLLERWTMHPVANKGGGGGGPAFTNPQWLLNAVRSQLHFSQLAAWRATLQPEPVDRVARRKLSRENCNFKKVEANCDEDELAEDKRSLNVVYSIRILGESEPTEFVRTPTDHAFPITDIGNNISLKVVLECLPRIDEIPTVTCTCKRRTSKEMPANIHEDLTGKLNDLTIGNRSIYPTEHAINSNIGTSARRLSIVSNAASTEYLYTTDDKDKMLDDRMHTNCSESGKHKCNCDEESDGKDTIKTGNEPKKLDERRLKEIAKYKRRLRKESKLKKLCDSTSSEGEVQQKAKETHTSIPILQAARFDRFRAIGCYRNQTYLTLPASRIESKSPFVESVSLPPTEFKKSNTVATQTDDPTCSCGNIMQINCVDCSRQRLVRSEANYDLAGLNGNNSGARRKCEEDAKTLKKHKCDNFSGNTQCDNIDNSVKEFIKRPKLQRTSDRIERLVADRSNKDIEDLSLKLDDSVFSTPQESKRQKTYSISEDDYVLYEKCVYGTFDNCESETMDSPKEDQSDFQFPESKKGVENQVPSPSEMDRFRWRFDSAASMVFHTKTGLPLTSSPAPLRRGNNCFDFDDSINGISGIKSALFHGSPRPQPPPPPPARRLRLGPSAGLLGSFEESALQGRLEPVATVAGFAAELGASGAFCPPHRRLPVTVFFYGTAHASYMGHINLGPSGYRVARSGTIQVSLFNPHGTLVKMFVVLYDLTCMPPMAKTFLRQRTLYMPAGADPPTRNMHKWLRYLIHLRFMTSKSGKLYLHTDIRIIVSRKSDIDTATAHVFRPLSNPTSPDENTNKSEKILTNSDMIPTNSDKIQTDSDKNGTNSERIGTNSDRHRPNRVFGGSSEFDSERKRNLQEIAYENQNGVSYELRSFTYAPENPKYSPR
ncbi:hypothetical protein ACJJTC_003741 [Scirpophaga incertulas]